jgi:hypothetical protein
MNANGSTRFPRRARLVLAIAAIATTATGTFDEALADSRRFDSIADHAGASKLQPRRPSGSLHTVTSCADDGSPGTLRTVIADPMTFSGDTVDLSQLTCGTITLGSEIRIHQDDLTLLGPDPGLGYVGIGAQLQHEVIQHFGYGTLQILGLSVVNGMFSSDSDATGGCIWSRGSVALVDSRVTRCHVHSASLGSVTVKGGGVYARNDLSLTRSTISYSQATSVFGGETRGGGAYVGGNLTSVDSTFEFNNARSSQGSNFGRGGAAFVHGGATVQSSTVHDNAADQVAGLMFYNPFPSGTAVIVSSTISGNSAVDSIGGIYSLLPLSISGSTIAFNASHGSSDWADGVYAGAAVEVTSSIIADNSGSKGLSDIGAAAGISVTGGNNLMLEARGGTPIPPDTVSTCPKLDPLLNTGGATLTHGLGSASPAIDNGDAGTATEDQRGLPRIVGQNADIGAVERQANETDERILSAGFEGPCGV